MTTSAEQVERPFFGWRLVGALGVILFFTGGGGFYVFPVFIESFQAEFGWSMTEISAGAAVFAIVMGISGPLVGVLFARIGARSTMLIAAALVAAHLARLRRPAQPDDALPADARLGFRRCGDHDPAGADARDQLVRRVPRPRARAGDAGDRLRRLPAPSFNEFLIRLVGWRLAWVVAGAITVGVVIPLIAIFVRTRPADLGQRPDGVQPGSDGAEAANAAPFSG